MDAEFDINTQKGKINCWELFRLRIHCKPFVGTGKIINTDLRGLPFQERKTIRQTNEKQWPAYNGVKKFLLRCKQGLYKIYNPVDYRISQSTKKSRKVSLIIKYPDRFFPYLGDELHFEGRVVSFGDLPQTFGKNHNFSTE